MSEPETARETHVSAYFDSELDAPSMQEVERALAGDPGLAEDLEDFGHLKSAIVAELERDLEFLQLREREADLSSRCFACWRCLPNSAGNAFSSPPDFMTI